MSEKINNEHLELEKQRNGLVQRYISQILENHKDEAEETLKKIRALEIEAIQKFGG